MLQNPGTIISGGVARQISGGTGQPSVWTTSSAGVAGRDALYTAAGANLADGDIGIIDTGGSPVTFRYTESVKNWMRTHPFSTSNAALFVEDAKSNGFRQQDATTNGWGDGGTAHSYSDPDNIMAASGSASYLQTDDLPFTMTEVGFILLHNMKIATGATAAPIFDLRRDDGASPWPNLRLRENGGLWQIQRSAGTASTGIAYAQNTDFCFEIYYNYATGRCWVYNDYSATPTGIADTSIILPTTTGTRSGLLLQNPDGVLSVEAAAFGHMRTQL